MLPPDVSFFTGRDGELADLHVPEAAELRERLSGQPAPLPAAAEKGTTWS
ncbi:hypothetical protein ACQPW3_17150 [Actinosynnema sp. CA-248983]